MNQWIKTSMVLLVFASLFLVGPVTAALNTITTGAIVFIGEDGLDITSAMGGDTRIGWWASGACDCNKLSRLYYYRIKLLQVSMSPQQNFYPTRVHGTALTHQGMQMGQHLPW